MLKAQRCQIVNKTNGKICSHKSKNCFVYNNIRYCRMHFNYYLVKYVTTIQSYYRGYKQSKIIKNIYSKLPDDVQKHILYFVRRDHYYQKFKKKINNIVYVKICNLDNATTLEYYKDEQIPFTLLNYVFNNSKKYEEIFNLYLKYKPILNNTIENEYLEIRDRNVDALNSILNMLGRILHIYHYEIINAHTNHIYNMVHVLFNRLDIIANHSTSLSSES